MAHRFPSNQAQQGTVVRNYFGRIENLDMYRANKKMVFFFAISDFVLSVWQSRSSKEPNTKPVIKYIRQLIYISLYILIYRIVAISNTPCY